MVIDFHTAGYRSDWNLEEISETVKAISGSPDNLHEKFEELAQESNEEDGREKIKEYAVEFLNNFYAEREKLIGEEGMRNLEKVVLLQTIDMLWMDHLDIMEHLRDSVRLRAYGQRDPLVEYKNEGSRLFKELQAAIRSQVVNTIYKVGVTQHPAPNIQQPIRPANLIFKSASDEPSILGKSQPEAGSRQLAAGQSPGRNDPCPCGAKHPDGRPKKYKHCHGK